MEYYYEFTNISIFKFEHVNFNIQIPIRNYGSGQSSHDPFSWHQNINTYKIYQYKTYCYLQMNVINYIEMFNNIIIQNTPKK